MNNRERLVYLKSRIGLLSMDYLKIFATDTEINNSLEYFQHVLNTGEQMNARQKTVEVEKQH